MKKTFSSKKSAFSLIELSIVLIVIGLLVAGVTGGASLIKSSELRSVMSEARGYSVAVSGFYSQFNALPGDYATSLGVPAVDGSITFTNAVGDGDSGIEYCSGTCTATGDLSGSENTIAWFQLKQAGAIDNSLTYRAAGVDQTAGTNFPASKVKAAGWVFDYNTTSTHNVAVLTGSLADITSSTNTPVNGTEISTGVITPSDALSVDSKIDDGVPATGKVRGDILSGCVSSSAYAVTTTTKACAISYRVDVNS